MFLGLGIGIVAALKEKAQFATITPDAWKRSIKAARMRRIRKQKQLKKQIHEHRKTHSS